MARTNRPATARRNMNTVRNSRGMYVDGSAARRLQEVPAREYQRPAEPARKRTPSQKPVKHPQQSHQLSKAARRNREKAMSMNRSFVVFLAVVSVAILFFSVNYLQLKSQITRQLKVVASLESELTDIREDNDAYESQVLSTADLNRIKKIAIGRLGMKYPSDEQKMTYTISKGSYVRQYQDIPDSK